MCLHACRCSGSRDHDKVYPLVDSAVRSDVALLGLGEDVLRERDRAYSVNPGEENLIVLRDLKKEFPPQDGNPKKTAVENMSVAIARGECFGCGPHGTCMRPMLVQSHFALRPVPCLLYTSDAADE